MAQISEGPVPGALSGAVSLINLNADPMTCFKYRISHALISLAMGENRLLIYGTGIASSYQAMIDDGTLPIILANRYTGQPVADTSVYSPGDFNVHYDAQGQTFNYTEHMGPLDDLYNPSAVTQGQLKSVIGLPSVLTNGKSLISSGTVNSEVWNGSGPSQFRERLGIPASDDSRTRIFIIYRAMNTIMMHGGEVFQTPLGSLEAYVALLGTKNPQAWLNPYTDLPMQEVPWNNSVQVSFYDTTVSMPDNLTYRMPPDPNPSIVYKGNYSCASGWSDLRQNQVRTCVLFYFEKSDGSIAAYLAYGFGSADYGVLADGWAGMAAGGMEPGPS